MILPGQVNLFNGLELEADRLPDSQREFARVLPAALQEWQTAGYRLIWLRVPIAKSILIETAVEAGFVFHHSQTDYLMLTLALEANTFIPHYATHYIGAGGVVIDDESRILVVSERFRRDRSRPHWKLPGGALHAGEGVAEAAIREVREETGVETEFRHLAAFRHWHGYRFAKSDIYMVCRLAPISTEITKDDHEIEHCIWMPLDEYLSTEQVGAFNKDIVRATLSDTRLTLMALPQHLPGSQEFFAHPDFIPNGPAGP